MACRAAPLGDEVRLDEAVRSARAAKEALRESEARWRREIGAAQAERMRLRAELANVLQRRARGEGEREDGRASSASGGSPVAKRARTNAPSIPSPDLDTAISRIELYAKYHEVESKLRAEQERADEAEEQLSRLAERVQATLPVYQERAARLDDVLAANVALSSRAAAAVREADATSREAERLALEVKILRTLAEEHASMLSGFVNASAVASTRSSAAVADPDGPSRLISELSAAREALIREQLAGETMRKHAVAKAEIQLHSELDEKVREAEAAAAEVSRLQARLDQVEAACDKWRTMYEATLESATTTTSAAGSMPPPPLPTVTEVRALLAAGATGLLGSELLRLQKEVTELRVSVKQSSTTGGGAPAPLDSSSVSTVSESCGATQEVTEGEARAEAAEAELATLRDKLASAEATAEKMRKAAAHWKTKHESAAKAAAARELAISSGVAANTATTQPTTSTLANTESDGGSALQEAFEAAKAEAAEAQCKADTAERAKAALEAELADVKAKLTAATQAASGTRALGDAKGAESDSTLQDKLAAAEASREKLRKTAAHWKGKYEAVAKQQLAAATAGEAACVGARAAPTPDAPLAEAAATMEAAHCQSSVEALTTEIAGLRAEAESAKAKALAAEAMTAELTAALATAQQTASLAAAPATTTPDDGGMQELRSTNEGLAAEVASLSEKLSAAEVASEKLRKATRHWKSKYEAVTKDTAETDSKNKVKELTEALAAAQAAAQAAKAEAASVVDVKAMVEVELAEANAKLAAIESNTPAADADAVVELASANEKIAAELAAVNDKLTAVEAASEKLLGDASYWKGKYEAATKSWAEQSAKTETELGATSKAVATAKAEADAAIAAKASLEAELNHVKEKLATAQAAAAAAGSVAGEAAQQPLANAELALLKERLSTAEAKSEKMRKAAAHWKSKYDTTKKEGSDGSAQAKIDLDVALAAAAAAKAEAEAALATKAALEAELSRAKLAASGSAGVASASAAGDSAADDHAAELSALSEKLAVAEAASDKFRKAASHWKGKYDSLAKTVSESSAIATESQASAGALAEAKIDLDVALAAAAAAKAEAEAALATKAALEAELSRAKLAASGSAGVASASAAGDSAADDHAAELSALSEKLAVAEAASDKFRKAASHWKGKYDSLAKTVSESSAIATEPQASAGALAATATGHAEAKKAREEVDEASVAKAELQAQIADLRGKLEAQNKTIIENERSIAQSASALEEIEALRTKLSAAEVANEKIEKAARHWKTKFEATTATSETSGPTTRASAAAGKPTGIPSVAEQDRAQIEADAARLEEATQLVRTLRQQLDEAQQSLSTFASPAAEQASQSAPKSNKSDASRRDDESADLRAQLEEAQANVEKFRKAAAHWKKQYNTARSANDKE